MILFFSAGLVRLVPAGKHLAATKGTRPTSSSLCSSFPPGLSRRESILQLPREPAPIQALVALLFRGGLPRRESILQLRNPARLKSSFFRRICGEKRKEKKEKICKKINNLFVRSCKSSAASE